MMARLGSWGAVLVALGLLGSLPEGGAFVRTLPAVPALRVRLARVSPSVAHSLHRGSGQQLASRLRVASISSAVSASTSGPSMQPLPALLLWCGLFALASCLHAAEAAITKTSSWQAQTFADAEGPRSPFVTLTRDLRRLLITILLTTTACSIYSTALFVSAMQAAFPQASLAGITALLTMLTLLLGEIVPKAVAVGNSEWVVRCTVPWIGGLATLMKPITALLCAASDAILRIAGLRAHEDAAVSEDMLRRVVAQASQSGSQGIEQGERRMITGVLDMQDKEVSRVMTPRVDMVCVDEHAAAQTVLRVAQASKYSRLPVFRGDVDQIVGVVMSRTLLPHVSSPSFANVTAAEVMVPAAYAPESMTCWDALQEMRRRSMHMLIVVDEYGGTSGLVTLEDILEEVVGEIYDEEDLLRRQLKRTDRRGGTKLTRGAGTESDISVGLDSGAASDGSGRGSGGEASGAEETGREWTIARSAGGFWIKSWAELSDVCEALDLTLAPEDWEHSTLGGLLSAVAGRIPEQGAVLHVAGRRFEISGVEGGRRLVDIVVRCEESADTGPGARLDPSDMGPPTEVFEDGHWQPR